MQHENRNYPRGAEMPLASDSAAEVRRKVNNPWSEPVAPGTPSGAAGVWFSEVVPPASYDECQKPFPGSKDAVEETGPRVRVTLITALPSAAHAEGLAVRTFENRLTQIAGGFTRDNVLGGWKDEAGGSVVEQGLRYTVSLVGAQAEWLEAHSGTEIMRAFRQLGRELGQEWIHVESETVNAHHFKV